MGRGRVNEHISRCDFLTRLIVAGVVFAAWSPLRKQIFASENGNTIRRFHISLQSEAWVKNPELINIMKNAGISDVCMGSYLQGKYYQNRRGSGHLY